MKTYTYDEINIGLKESFFVTVTKDMLESFEQITYDHNPMHTNEEFAKSKGYKGQVAYGMLTASFMSTVAGMYLPGERSLILGVEAEFPNPVYINDVLNIEAEVKEKNDTFNFIVIKVVVRNQDNLKVLRGKMKVKVLD